MTDAEVHAIVRLVTGAGDRRLTMVECELVRAGIEAGMQEAARIAEPSYSDNRERTNIRMEIAAAIRAAAGDTP